MLKIIIGLNLVDYVINQLIQNKSYNILLIGDISHDIYVYGDVERISPEAPVPVFKESYRISSEGMSNNVKQNLIALNSNVEHMYGEYSIKTRLVDKKSGYQLIRLDKETDADFIYFDPLVYRKFSDYDAIVISDYDKGYIKDDTVSEIRKRYNGPIFVDTKKKNLELFNDTYLKINDIEWSRSNKVIDSKNVIVTRGSKGATYNGKDYITHDVEVHDVTGAGDVFLASIAVFYLHLGSIEKAIPYALKLSTESVKHRGSYVVTKEDIDKL